MGQVANNKMFFPVAYHKYKQTTAYMTDGNVVPSNPIQISSVSKFYYSHILKKYYVLYITCNELRIHESIDGLTWT